MNCLEPKCEGVIDQSTTVELMVGCASYRPAQPCGKCGRLYWLSGDAVFNRGSKLVFLNDDGELAYRDPPEENKVT